ncbi:TPA: hypothetical protein DEO28_04060 [Candidatus Dependentiae bacterium]|nr:MAG: hypothetical protein UR14_C0006G0049 [candidate division TM6 bacterium GW2011_GWE2_31_21]KKP53528.1 MAG: hypothetical protein UR43_C0004G0069 [candidate division TM6 bacterium GW2011_GWF2_33_332]HBS48231.1 hypothetical protein [Candidatus Dependentiae bacterium]HBZ73657.1 hypothetical protein [Candidatus Dependentiae bacterium]
MKIAKKAAFTFLEVIVAMGLFASISFIIFYSQKQSLNFIFKRREEASRVFLVKEYLYKKIFHLQEDLDEAVWKKSSFKKKFEKPELVINLSSEGINGRSSLKDFSKHLDWATCEGSWKSFLKGRSNESTFKLKALDFKK